jgi:DNA-directed RNA polymerase beta' subunit
MTCGRVINRNNRLKRLQGLCSRGYYEMKKDAQESVDACLTMAVGRHWGPNTVLKSEMLKGKKRFVKPFEARGYSGRSVIVVDPQLKP